MFQQPLRRPGAPSAAAAADLPGAHARRRRSARVDPITVPLRDEVRPRCGMCDRAMDSWDLYYDHLNFDRAHQANASRTQAERTPRPRYVPAAPDQSDPALPCKEGSSYASSFESPLPHHHHRPCLATSNTMTASPPLPPSSSSSSCPFAACVRPPAAQS
ncbi:hypothetical protein H4R18_005299 [Coemansia javaensis]|uniref:Uncharacterized protein n=1 Tax=Coemansia javaensis TaxID=2761396 RepID=A0A9W8H2Z1_9FUNG|nr:hypothetical protein H4R18_005299 [Coemansia javaensis]